MLRIAPFLLLGLGSFAAAADSHALSVCFGAAWRHENKARDVTDTNGDFSWTDDYGFHARLSSGAPSPGMIGWGAFDIDWARNVGNGDRIDTVGVLYIERMPISTSLSLGLGLGSFYNDVSIDEKRDSRWTIGGTATLSMSLFGPLYVEAGYDMTSLLGGKKTGGIKTDCMFLDLGLKF